MKKKLLAILLILSMLMLSACSSQSGSTDANDEAEGANTTTEQTTVTFYGWGGSEVTNAWIDGYLTDAVAKKYNIKLERVGMNIDEILNLLLNEKQAGTDKGSIDIIWINGENFASAKENGLLFGPFASELENFSKYLDPNSPDVMFDFGVATEGYEVPFGKAQFVMVYDSSLLSQVPVDHKALLEMAKNNPGKFTYPAPPDFTGSAFVRNIIYDIVGYEQFLTMDADYDTVKSAIMPAMDYLKELKPYLWNQGKTYPASLSILDNMYADGEVFMTMDYNPNSASSRISTGEFPEATKTFIFDKGSIGNTHFVAIPFNSPNVEGAKAVINEIISVEAQAKKYDPSGWGDLPVLDNSKLSDDEKKVFDSIPLGKATLPQDELMSKRMPELPAKLVPIIEQIWMETIAAESN
ncbi:putative spermidine/putrescine transport system substrate-binding protein [Acetoanaerobium noterae]|uniref:Putative spermidine/putrescine transport system substrate-binding protein n=1 Tax=Acetoanaerobium noterae TaxID=745369 RepID=A0A1T5BGX7_9FIRM|nr:ABC transporter substrate-binding protein [Acetoanaerobium noterae]SKB46542.1 putative spermidine/putrescine transport system substrate-binding protein [Acetoanaerobium noterae]